MLPVMFGIVHVNSFIPNSDQNLFHIRTVVLAYSTFQVLLSVSIEFIYIFITYIYIRKLNS